MASGMDYRAVSSPLAEGDYHAVSSPYPVCEESEFDDVRYEGVVTEWDTANSDRIIDYRRVSPWVLDEEAMRRVPMPPSEAPIVE
jgi:hypothetical protein